MAAGCCSGRSSSRAAGSTRALRQHGLRRWLGGLLLGAIAVFSVLHFGKVYSLASHKQLPSTSTALTEAAAPATGEGTDGGFLDPFNRTLPASLLERLQRPWAEQDIPVVHFFQRPGRLPCSPDRYVFKTLKQVRWFVLHAFMERHAIPRLFYSDSDVLLFANVTEFAALFLPRSHVALPMRWPSLRFFGPSQYASPVVSGHASFWTYEALSDFLRFFILFFKEAVLFGEKGDKKLTADLKYNDMVTLGWYTHSECWLEEPEDLNPPCNSGWTSGMTPDRSAKLRGRFAPKYKVEPLCLPRWCNETKWSDEGWCVFDNNFSVQKSIRKVKYRPEEGMKLPTSMHYAHFEDWIINSTQTTPVQFLCMHFQGGQKSFIDKSTNPAISWGSHED